MSVAVGRSVGIHRQYFGWQYGSNRSAIVTALLLVVVVGVARCVPELLLLLALLVLPTKLTACPLVSERILRRSVVFRRIASAITVLKTTLLLVPFSSFDCRVCCCCSCGVESW